MTSKGESERRGLPAGWEWREDEDGFAVRLYPPGRNDLDYAAVSYRDGSFVAYLGADTSEEIASADLDEPCTPETRAAAQRAAEAALWARDGFGVGEVRGVVLGDEWTVPVGLALDAPKSCPMALPGLPGLWTLTRVSSARPIAVDAVRVPFDTQAEADAAPLTHALDAEGNALCPYDPARLAYVSPRADRVTCPACVERVQATAEPAPLPWNWCPTCKQHVDIDADTHEGERTRCLGCRVWYVVCRDGDGAWWLQTEAEHDAEDAEPAPREPNAAADRARELDAMRARAIAVIEAAGGEEDWDTPAELVDAVIDRARVVSQGVESVGEAWNFERQNFGLSQTASDALEPVWHAAFMTPRRAAPREPSTPNLHDQIRAVSFIAPTPCSCGANVAHWIVRERVSRCNGCGVLTDHRTEPPVATDAAELARLLPALAHDLDMVTELRFESQRSTPIQRVARACKPLLAERAPLAAERDRWKALAHKACADACDADATIDDLRARLAAAESYSADLLVFHSETVRAFDQAAPDALRALRQRQHDAAKPSPEMAEKIRAVLRKKPAAVKKEDGDGSK